MAASSSASAAARLLALRFLAGEDDEDHGGTMAAGAESETTSQSSSSSSDTTQQPWGDVILASLIVQTATLTGLIISSTMRCCGKNSTSPFWTMVSTLVIPSFAGGALLATAIFLIIPEALHLVPLVTSSSATASFEEELHSDEEQEHEEQDDHSDHDHYRYLQEEDDHHDEPDQPWKVGTAILGGFLFPMFFWIVFPGHHHHGFEENSAAAEHHSQEHVVAASQNEDLEVNNKSTNQATAPPSGDDTTTTVHDTTTAQQKQSKMASEEDEYDDDYEYNDVDDNEPVSSPPPPMAVPAVTPEETEEEHAPQKNESSAGAAAAAAATVVTRKPINYTLAASILVGDFFHNFTDGVFLGSAFSLCSRELGYTLVASTVYHELAQEIADFFLLTNHCYLLEWEALALNFVAGFSVMIGALMVLAIDMTDKSKGIILALSAGVYLHIAASECVPRAQGQCKKSKDALIFLLCFILGVVPIGLVLLNHGHCEADGHEGH